MARRHKGCGGKVILHHRSKLFGGAVLSRQGGGVMEKYDPDAKCSKCGYSNVTTEHYLGRMIRVCKRCTYRWYEAPLDSIDKEEENQ